MLKSKIHRVTVTDADERRVGSLVLDADLMDAADLRPGELVHVLDLDNGTALETYVVSATRGSGKVVINGAAAKLVRPGDFITVIGYAAPAPTGPPVSGVPRVVFVTDGNRLAEVGGSAL